MFALNYLYFLIITMLLLQYLQMRSKKVKHPLQQREILTFSGPEMFWTLLFSTGLLAFSAPAGLDLMALRLLSLEIFCLMCLSYAKGKPSYPFPVVLYIIFMLWLVVGCFYSPAPAYGVRVILKYLYPLVVVLAASAVVRRPEVMMKASLGARAVALVALLITFTFVEHIVFPGVFWYATARAINYISICMFSLALFFYMGKERKNLIYAILFTLPCILWVFRTSIMGTVVGLMVFSLFRYKIKAFPVIALIAMLGVACVFYVPAVKEKMFKDDTVTLTDFVNGKVNQDGIESNARFDMWEYFENRFYKNKEVQGSGTGAVQHHFYNNFLFGGLKVMHSDMVQMKCDNGLVALWLYYSSIVLMIGHAFMVFCRNSNRWIKICAITAGSAMAGVAVTMYSDNVVNYSMCTLAYPFGFYGMMLGLLKAKKKGLLV